MAWRFRRSLKLLPGVRLNFGKRGFTSVSVGGRGATLNFGGKTGPRQTIGLPGTGLSFTSRLKSTGRRSQSPAPAQPVEPLIDPMRFGIVPVPVPPSAGRARIALFTVAGLSVGGAIVAPPLYTSGVSAAAVVVFLMALVCRSKARLERDEQRRTQDLARVELERRIKLFAATVGALSAPGEPLTAGGVRAALSKRYELLLSDREVQAFPIEALEGTADLLEFKDRVQGYLPPVVGHDQYVAPDMCYFAGEAVFDKRGDNDPSGTLYLTNDRVIFRSPEGLTTAAWSKVVSAELDSRTLSIQRRDRQTPYRFDFATYGEAMKAEFIAQNMRTAVERPAGEIAADRETSGPAASQAWRDSPETAAGPHGFVAVVGESFYQDTLRGLDLIFDEGDRVFMVRLAPEPDNPHDPNAVAVVTEGNAKVGYLSRDVAKSYHKVLLRQPVPVLCPAKLTGRGQQHIGVVLDFDKVRHLKDS